MPDGKIWSWALPKQQLPTVRGEKRLAVWVDDKHIERYMTFQGFLGNGDRVELYDYGLVILHKFSKFRLTVEFQGKVVNGIYDFIKTDPNWLILKTR